MILTIFYTVSALDAFSFSMFITIMAPYMLSLGGTQSLMGIMGSICALITLIWNPIMGSLSDKFGRKKGLLSCLFICFIANIMLAIYESLTIFFISRMLASLGTQIATLVKSLIDDNIKLKDEKMAAINKIQALAAFSFIFGSIFSGHLSEYENGMKYIFITISATFAINFVLISLVKDTTTKASKKSDEKSNFNIFKEIKLAAKNLSEVNWPKYWDLFVMKLIFDFSINFFQFNAGPILAKRFEITGKYFGYVIALMSIIGISTSLGMMKVKSHFYSKDDSGFSRLLHGNIILLVTFLGMSLSTNLTFFLTYLVPLGVGRVLLETTFTEVLLSRASQEEKGSIMGTFDSTMSLGGLVAPILSGFIAETWGESLCLFLCTLPLGMGAFLTYSQKTKVE